MNEDIKILFRRYLANTATRQEEEMLEKWIASNDEVQNWLRQEWENSPETMDCQRQQLILEKIHRNMNLGEVSVKKHLLFPKALRFAAAVILLFVIATTVWINFPLKGGKVQYTTIQAMRGQKTNVVLPDGTRVKLNSGSQIVYGTDYNTESRTVLLKGEAYFTVAHNKTCPFIVNTGELSVRAVGTAFNVNAYPEERYFLTTLVEGKVVVKIGDKAIDLLPNEQIRFDKNTNNFSKIKLNDVNASVAWLTNQIYFNNSTFAEVASTLSRIYNIDIVFHSDSIKYQRLTGRINNNSLESVLRILTLSSPVRYEIKDGKVILYEIQAQKKLFR